MNQAGIEMDRTESRTAESAGKPIGTEAYDRSYGLGYRVGHGELSPYARVNRLRRTFFAQDFDIDVSRAVIVTEVYQAHEDLPPVLRGALALEAVLQRTPIEIWDDELIVGEIAAPPKAAPVYPEFSVSWIIDELLHHPFEARAHDRFLITEENRDRLLQILPYWEGKTVADAMEGRLSEDIRLGNELGKKVYMTNLYHYGGIGHYSMDYARLMRVGFGGLLQEAEAARAAIRGNSKADNERRDFLQASAITLRAATDYILRYADLAREKAADVSLPPARREELRLMEKSLRQIASGPAVTFQDALQLWHFATTIAQIESNGHSVSYGRMDQWLYPYYRRSLEEGTDKQYMQELLECAYIKMNNPSKLKDRMTVQVRNGRGWGGESLTIGGVDASGRDATNDLTFMMLEASVHTRMMNPWVCLRMHEGTPHELKVKAFECIRAGYGHPKLYNDATAIKVMQKKGMTLEEARDYAVVGCVEPDLPGREFGLHDAAYVNMVKVMELAINGGRCIGCGETCPLYARCAGRGRTLGPDTGSLRHFQSMEEVLESFRAQLQYWADRMCETVDAADLAQREVKPTPFASSLFSDCIKRGRDLTGGGAVYNFSGPQACGIASCADSLSAISQLVFEEKSHSGAELMDALEADYAGYEMLYALINSAKVHHFGNDDDRADRYYRFVFDTYCSAVEDRKNVRGGFFTPGVYSVNANVGMGLTLAASLDGRKAGEPISDNMGPVHTAMGSHDISGPTAIANSVNKVDHSRATNGTLLNWKFTPGSVSGVSGRENLISFTDAYFKGNATHCQFNIMSSETMRRAMAHPEDYRDMLVRVAGYSAYFVELSRPLQMDLITRTELSF